MEYKEQNKRSFDGVTRRFELECCTFLRRQGNVQLEYGHVTPQISPNLMLSANS